MQTKNAALEYVVVGLGVNVNMEEFPEELPYATSLRIQGEKVYEQEEIVIMFLKYFHTHYALFIRKGFFAIKEDYKKNCITLHSSVKVMEQNDSYETYIIDIDDEGALISKDSNGRVKKIMAGEVSIRGIYGYV
jgi:BirA family biotin operon repressor/biotin-[acetyl-CoA-carboxylase] ligase